MTGSHFHNSAESCTRSDFVFYRRKVSTYGLCQSNHYFLAGGSFSDPADNPLDSIHPDLELHVGSKARGPVVVCWPRHYWRLQWCREAEAPLAPSLRRKHREKQEAVSQDVLKATIINASRLKELSPNRNTIPLVVIPTKTSSQISRIYKLLQHGKKNSPVENGLVQLGMPGPALLLFCSSLWIGTY